jgi:hypothetical protein
LAFAIDLEMIPGDSACNSVSKLHQMLASIIIRLT